MKYILTPILVVAYYLLGEYLVEHNFRILIIVWVTALFFIFGYGVYKLIEKCTATHNY